MDEIGRMSDEFREYVIDLLEVNEIPALLADLSSRIGRPVAYRDILSNRTFSASDDALFNEMTRSYPLQELRRIFASVNINEDSTVYGILIVSGEYNMRSPIIAAASLGLRLLIRRENTRERKKMQFIDNFLADILSGVLNDPIELGERLRIIGYDGDGACFALVIETSSESPLPEKHLTDIVKTFFPRTIYKVEASRIICAVFPQKSIGKIAVGENIRNLAGLLVRRFGDAVKLGIGSTADSLLSFAKSADEAAKAIFLGSMQRSDEAIFVWEKLGTARIIGLLAGTSEGRELYSMCLGKIAEFDMHNSMDLIETLSALDDNCWNMRMASEQLNVHINTVKYRYSKICELISSDLRLAQTRFNVSLALRLGRIYEFKKTITEGRKGLSPE